MSNYSEDKEYGKANTDDEDVFADKPAEDMELLKRALSEVMETRIRKIEEETKDMDLPPHSRRHKIRMNRLFRERVGSSNLPFPEVDNIYERIRSKIVIKLKINEFLDRRKNRRC